MTLPVTDPVLVFAIFLVIILTAPILSAKLRLPDIIGLIVAGIIVGPHSIGLLERGETIELLGMVGLLYIMFLAGLEIDLQQVKKNGSHTVIFGLLTFALPLVVGTTAAATVLSMSFGAAVLLASMFSSHTLITFPIASRLGLTKNRAVTTGIGGTIITDTLAMIVLAVVASSTRGRLDAMFWVRLGVLIVVYAAVVVWGLPRVGRWFFRREVSNDVADYVFVLSAVFVCGYVAHLVGLEPIIGAFLAGLTLNSLIPEKSILMNRINFVGNAVFIPFFLVSVGMLVDVRLLVTDAGAWIVSITMVTVALFTKWIAAKFTIPLLKYNRDEAGLIYGLSVNQAAATLAAVLVGYRLEIFTDSVLTGTILMIAVTCFVGPIVTQKYGKRVALAEQETPYDPSTAPHRILVPIADAESAREISEVAFLLHKKESHESVYPLFVAMDGPDADEAVANGEKILAHIVVRAIASSIPVIPVTRLDITVSAGVLKALRDLRVSLVVIGWDGASSVRRRTFGRVLDPIVQESRSMVLVNRLVHPIATIERIILVAPPMLDRQSGFADVVHTVKTLAHQTGARLIVTGVGDTVERCRLIVESGREKVDATFEPVTSWKKVIGFVTSIATENDHVILMSARLGRLAWQPDLDRFPGHLVSALPRTNISALYPPIDRWTSDRADDSDEREYLERYILPPHIVFNLDGVAPGPAIRRLLAEEFASQPNLIDTVATELERIGRDEPVPLLEDVVLIHAHVTGITEPMVFFGVNQSGFVIPRCDTPPQVMIVLLNPVDHAPERHLEILATVARFVKRPGVVPLLLESRSYDDFVSRLKLLEFQSRV